MKSLILNDDGLKADDRPAHEILRNEPLRSIPIGGDLHMVVHAREAGDGTANAKASMLLSQRGVQVNVDGDAVIVRAYRDVDAIDAAVLAYQLLTGGERVQ